MPNRIKRWYLGLLWLGLCLVSPGFALGAEVTPTQAASQPATRAIPFKQESQSLAGQAGQSFAMLMLAIGTAVAILYAVKKYLPKLAPSIAIGKGKRLKLIEVMRLSPKTSLFLVQFDDTTLLLGQQGESINIITTHPQKPEPATPVAELT